MPLAPGTSRHVISNNIREMVAAGHPQKQAVAASLANARRHPRAVGGLVPPATPSMPVQHLDLGGTAEAPWWMRSADRELQSGLLHSPLGAAGGRSDTLPHSVAANSYIMPADVISGLGMGDTMSGASIMQHILDSMPFGIKPPRRGGGSNAPHAPAPVREQADGGALMPMPDADAGTGKVPVLLANGEFHIGPRYIQRAGNGNYQKGHKVFDSLVKHVRQRTIAQLQKLPPPVK